MDAGGAAVGVASLGIQLCQGILTYYHDWRSCYDDISTAYEKVSVLKETFAQLKNSLHDPFLDDARKMITHRCLISCQKGLSRLQKLLDKLPVVSQSPELIARATAAVNRAVYPFRTNAFKNIVKTVDGLVDDLALALQVLHLDLGATSHSKVVAVHTTLQSVLGKLANNYDETRALERKLELLSLTNQENFETVESALELSKLAHKSKVNEHRRIMAWLRSSSRDPLSDHQVAREKCLLGTGQWILDDKKYKQWKHSMSCLWIYGKAGCGKTILCSTIIEDLKPYYSQGRRALAFFYFMFIDVSNQIYADLLSSVIQQLSMRSRAAYEVLKENYYDEDSKCHSLLKHDLLKEILFLTINEFDEVVLVLDGVDEIPGEKAKMMVLHLLEHISTSLSNVKVLIVSRHQTEIAASAAEMSAECLPIHHDSNNEDIRSYVTHHFTKDARLSQWNPELRARVQSAFELKADGM
jgi:hypothetical protein